LIKESQMPLRKAFRGIDSASLTTAASRLYLSR
jgi:hypothetical protein